jgi:hypothetical protein
MQRSTSVALSTSTGTASNRLWRTLIEYDYRYPLSIIESNRIDSTRRRRAGLLDAAQRVGRTVDLVVGYRRHRSNWNCLFVRLVGFDE